jgi:hypothetical protein
MDTTNINANRTGAGTLGAFFADSGFNPGPSATGLIVANTSALQTGTSESQTAYANTGIVNPLSSTNLTPIPGGGQCGLTLSSLPPGVNALPTGCNTPVPSFSLEIATMFTTGVGGGGFDVGGNISTVPEPTTVALFGTVLALCASSLRRKRKLS